jgi:hypothetical protein
MSHANIIFAVINVEVIGIETMFIGRLNGEKNRGSKVQKYYQKDK